MTKVLIGIQARSGSTRLPNKAHELILGKTMLDRVIAACKRAAFQIKEDSTRRARRITCHVVVLTPENDPIKDAFPDRCQILEGPECDVLTRYVKGAEIYEADYVVRITGDCPMIPHYVINRHIDIAVQKGYDYLSNVHEKYRTSLDGVDCEVMSKKLVDYLDKNAKDPLDREHVTTYARKFKPVWAKYGHVVNYFDQSDIKLSVDTKEDLERVRIEFEKTELKYRKAILEFGEKSVHRL